MPYRDKEKERLAKLGYRVERRAIVEAMKLDHGCSICGYDRNTAALHFHHVGKKHKDITRMLASNTSMKRIMEEIDECVILCANCHAELHNPQEQ